MTRLTLGLGWGGRVNIRVGVGSSRVKIRFGVGANDIVLVRVKVGLRQVVGVCYGLGLMLGFMLGLGIG